MQVIVLRLALPQAGLTLGDEQVLIPSLEIAEAHFDYVLAGRVAHAWSQRSAVPLISGIRCGAECHTTGLLDAAICCEGT
jgi:hypothetical protein